MLIVTGLVTAIENIYRCVERVGLKVKDIVLEPLASSFSVLTEEEKEVGVALVDIGGGTTDIAVFEENIIRYISVFGIGGRQITNDIRQIMGIIASEAEHVKRTYGHAYEDSIKRDEVIMIQGVGGRKPLEPTKKELCRIIQPRMEEIFEFVYSEIQRSGFANRLGAGIVITGGTTLLFGADQLAEHVFGMPVKIGIPSGIKYVGLAQEIESPVYSTSVGLALYGFYKDLGLNVPLPADQHQEKTEETTELSKVEIVSEPEKPKKAKRSLIKRSVEFIKQL